MRRQLMAALFLVAVVVALGVMVGLRVSVLLDVDRSVGSAFYFGGGGAGRVRLLEVLTAPGLSVFRLVVLVPVAALFAMRRRWRMSAFVLVPALVIGPLTVLIKNVVGRARPTADDPLVTASGLSFPSGHAAGAATLAGVLLVVLWPSLSRAWKPVVLSGLLLLTIEVAWTRMALGVHYLSDTVGGLSLGAALVLVSMAVFRPHSQSPAKQPRPSDPPVLPPTQIEPG